MIKPGRILMTLLIAATLSCNIPNPSYPRPKNAIRNLHNRIRADSTLITGLYYVSDTNTGFRKIIYKKRVLYMVPDTGGKFHTKVTGNDTFYLNPVPIVTANDLALVRLIYTDANKYPGLQITFYDDMKSILRAATRKALHKKLGFVIDDSLISAPEITDEIPNGILDFNGAFDMQKIKSELEFEMPKSVN